MERLEEEEEVRDLERAIALEGLRELLDTGCPVNFYRGKDGYYNMTMTNDNTTGFSAGSVDFWTLLGSIPAAILEARMVALRKQEVKG